MAAALKLNTGVRRTFITTARRLKIFEDADRLTAEDILHSKKNTKIYFRLGWENGSTLDLEYQLRSGRRGIKQLVLCKYTYRGAESYIEILRDRSDKYNVTAVSCLTFGKYTLFEAIMDIVKEAMAKVDRTLPKDKDIFNKKVHFKDVNSVVFRHFYEFNRLLKFK